MASPRDRVHAAWAAALLMVAGTVAAQGRFAAVPDDSSDADVPMPTMASPRAFGPPVGVRKLSDSSLTCEQLQAESTALEQSVAKHRATADTAQQEAQQMQEKMMKQAMSPGGGMAGMAASSLLGMVPGGGMVSSLAAQAAAQAQMSSMQQAASDMTRTYQQLAQSHEQMQHAAARNDHLIDLFLKKGCQLPAAGAAAVPAPSPAAAAPAR